MKNVLIIIGNHSPEPSSVASSMAPLIATLSDYCNVDVVTDRKDIEIPQKSIENNINIYRVDDVRSIASNRLNNHKNNFDYFKKLFSLFIKIVFYLRYIFLKNEVNNGGWEVNSVLKYIIKLDNIRKYDLIISVSLPFKSHLIAKKIKKIKNESTKWVAIAFDPYTFNTTFKNNFFKKNKRYYDENNVFKNADKILLTPELFNYYSKNMNFSFSSKVEVLPYASLERVNINSKNIKKLFLEETHINCLFLGRLYGDIRNPKYLLEVFKHVNSNIKVTMISNYTSKEIYQLTSNEYSPTMIPFQNKDTALYNMVNADILINIGNTVEHQVPGKIFEYMSTGKPIIHFSKIHNDPAIKYFERYPNVLIIREWENNIIADKNRVEKFSMSNRYNTLTFEEVNKSMREYSSECVKNRFINILEKTLGESIKNE